MTTYEEIRTSVSELPTPTGEKRNLHWILRDVAAIGRTARDAYELFICGEELKGSYPLTRDALHHDQWRGEGPSFFASRIVFPNAPHFSAVASSVAVELLRQGVETDPQAAFSAVEPLIELVLERSILGPAQRLGLVGELYALRGLIARWPVRAADFVASWRGHTQSSHDFLFGSLALEVKTTKRNERRHRFSGFGQLESLGSPVILTGLRLLSVRVVESGTSGMSIPELTESIVQALGGPNEPSAAAFLDRISQYGSEGTATYDHARMAAWDAYQTRYLLNGTPLLYDLLDEDLALLRAADLDGTYVDPDSVSFTAVFPEVVNGLNPAPDWLDELENVLPRVGP